MRDDSTGDSKKEHRSRESGFEEDGSFFNRVRSDALKRKLESMLKDGKFKSLVSELKMPREIVAHIMNQIDDTKQAALSVFSREVRLFFENTNLADELARLLSQLSFEVSTKVRFVRNEPEERASSGTKKKKRGTSKGRRPKVETRVSIDRNDDEIDEPDDDQPSESDGAAGRSGHNEDSESKSDDA